MEGLAAAAVWLGAAFWGSMAIDWMFEPPHAVRAVILALAGMGLAVVLFLFILRRAFVRLSDDNLATVLERQFPQLNDSLLTSVSLQARPSALSGFNPAMLACTSYVAQQRLKDVSLSRVFDPMPIVRKIVIALGLGSIIGFLAVMDPADLRLWAQRNLLLTNAMWPRKIRLEAVGFTDGVAKVAAGANFDLRVRAFRGDTEIPVIPERVEVRYRVEGGGRDRKVMKNIGQPSTSAAADEVLQEYSCPFTGVLSSIHLDIAGGDGRLYGLLLKVVPNPNLNLNLVCEYPRYMERGPLVIESASSAVPVRVPIGSRITVRGVADKPLEMARIDCPPAQGSEGWRRQFEAGELGNSHSEFAHTFYPFPAPTAKAAAAGEPAGSAGKPSAPGSLSPASNTAAKAPPTETMLQFTLRDADGLKLREPVFLTLVAVPDEPPEVKVRLVGTREPCVTPKGRLPVTGTISDDHGLARAWFDYAVEERAPATIPVKLPGEPSKKPDEPRKAPRQRSGQVPLAELPKHLPEYTFKEADVKASQLNLATGQRLTLTVRAADLCTFLGGPNVGSGESWQLDVVSEDELVTRLEARELLVKQRFEQIVEEVTETRNLLLKMDFSPPRKAGAGAPKAKSAGAEPGERQEESPIFSVAELNKRRLERTLQALQNCRKNALETADIAAAIEEIRLQLDNNEANNESRKQRIGLQVLRPLHEIVDSLFPVLDQRLVALQGVVDDLSKGPVCRDAAQQQADRILAMMRTVLDHMMKTEDFNVNVIQRLKKIIQRQKELNQRTEKTEQESLGEKE